MTIQLGSWDKVTQYSQYEIKLVLVNGPLTIWRSDDSSFFKRLHKGLVQEGIGMTWWSWLFFNFHRAESRAEYYSIVKLGSSISFISISGILGKGKNSNFFCLGFKLWRLWAGRHIFWALFSLSSKFPHIPFKQTIN